MSGRIGYRFTRTAAALAASTLLLGLPACGSDEGGSGGGGGSTPEVGVMLFNTELPFYAPLQDGLRSEARKLGVDVDIQNGQLDPARQAQLVQQFTTQNKDVIIISASDADAIVPSVKQANSQDIPVMGLTNDVGKGAERLTYIGTDNVEFGRLLGKGVVEEVGEDAKVGLILGALGTTSQRERTQGFKEYVKKHPGIQILEEQTGNWDNADALKVGQDFLNKYGEGEIDSIVVEGPEGAAPARYAARNGRDDVKFVVGDISRDVQAQLKSGSIAAAVFQDPFQQARTAIQYAKAIADGKEADIPKPFAYAKMQLFGSRDWDKVPANALF